jgi:outer membrane lipoprotein-sorting protein
MTAEEVIKKHLDSIGTAEDRAKIKNQAILGTFKFTLPLRKDLQYSGTLAFAAESAKRLFGMNFNQETKPDYNTERIIYNEKDVKIAAARFNQRSALGEFLFRNDKILRDGLFGGALFNIWALNSFDVSKAKVDYDGKKKVNGIEAHTIEYSPKKGFGFTIKLYFDATTFQHIRTEYRRTIGAQIGPTPESSAGQAET